MIHPPNLRSRAFTFTELLVMLAIMAVLGGLLLLAVQKVRESVRAHSQNDREQAHLVLPVSGEPVDR